MSDVTRQKQLDIVLKLNKLTKKDRIKWERSLRASPLEPSREGAPFGTLEQFKAEYKGRTFKVKEVSNSPVLTLRGLMQSEKPEGSFRLVVSESEEEANIVIPPIPAIDDLVETIRRSYQEGEIEELEELDRLLEEDL